ncbi:MAG TPA: hypothetical protein VLG40_02760 [Candidatus Saccharimonas sp.]|nr:hypothetical protein [Candidatus Saccharimonas sp.]
MTRLPVPGADPNAWGDILNEFLMQSHNPDGSLKAAALGSTVVVLYDTTKNAYPPRPSGVPAGYVLYKGPVAPTDAQRPDTWEDTTGIWP